MLQKPDKVRLDGNRKENSLSVDTQISRTFLYTIANSLEIDTVFSMTRPEAGLRLAYRALTSESLLE